ncbi:MAG: biotin--[acetyl-CoA-carboxylase] ligase [Tissierellia bacterium]|nr:biotin--[acetyl-CoA-carboxylase] ligase [Tissierellia bacterium]
MDGSEALNYRSIEAYLDTNFVGRNIRHYNSLSSTNVKAKEIAMDVEEGTVIIAEEQTAGRGRLGRNWISPKGRGIWMSLILKPVIPPAKVARITLIGAAAVNKALGDMGIESHIKWPNDIIIDNRKVSGILTEMSCERNMVSYVIMGIGINLDLKDEELSEELAHKAISLREVAEQGIDRKILLAYILNHLEKLYIPFKMDGDISGPIEIARRNSILIGRDVWIRERDMRKKARVLDIDDEGRLMVQYDDGGMGRLASGEISIRGLEGYF